jgi:hypothetical protein
MSQEDLKAAGASAARNKLAGFLRERGLKIPFRYTPPEDEDFWYAIQEFAERHGATLPHFGEESVASRRFRESLESYRREQQTRPALIDRSPSQTNSKEVKCRYCGDSFVPKRGKPGFIDECPVCLRKNSRGNLGSSDAQRTGYLGFDLPEQTRPPVHRDRGRFLQWIVRRLKGK